MTQAMGLKYLSAYSMQIVSPKTLWMQVILLWTIKRSVLALNAMATSAGFWEEEAASFSIEIENCRSNLFALIFHQ